MVRKKYKNKKEEIKDLFEKFKKQSNTIYWTGILSLVSFIIMLFRENKTYTLGFSVNVILHKLLIDSIADKFWAYALSLVFVLIISAIFYFLSKQVKKGKFIPLLITIIIYSLDSITLFFIRSIYETDWDYAIAFGVHIIALGYFIYLIYLFNKIVTLSNENNKNK